MYPSRRVSPSHLAIAIATIIIVAGSRHPSADEILAAPHVRSVDRGLAALIAEGARRSASFRALIDRIDRSNLIVHVEYRPLPPPLGGRTSLAGTQHAWRYARVEIHRRLGPLAQLVMLGHELQHVAEIAEWPAAVDDESMTRLYQRIGFPVDGDGHRFETEEAREAGSRIYSELLLKQLEFAAP